MQVTPMQAQKLLTGSYSFSMLGFSMLITRLKGIYAKNPAPATLQTCVKELNAFLQKYANVMAADAAVLTKL